jgi:hypothetical protein
MIRKHWLFCGGYFMGAGVALLFTSHILTGTVFALIGCALSTDLLR